MSTGLTNDALVVTRTIAAPTTRVFDVLADPATHEAIDGTGWVLEPLDGALLTHVGQVFGMGMHHANHPDGRYEMHNRVEVLDRPTTIAWQPGQYGPDAALGFGGWVWRYDLEPDGPDACRATLTYDWSAVPSQLREYIGFPPVGEEHFTRSLDNLAALAERGR